MNFKSPQHTEPRRERAEIALKRLLDRYPGTTTSLNAVSPWEILVATVLAAQCTDARVNAVTPEFFRRWPDPETLARAGRNEVERVIRSTGFFRNKASHLIQCARIIRDRHEGKVPASMEDLLRLPGVARKTANIVLSAAYGIQEGIAVDTHVKRLANRLDLTRSENPDRIEKDLVALFPRSEWGRINHLLVQFGRDVCRARTPRCSVCELNDICPRRGVANGKAA
jgi:endonuclease-3